MRRRGEEGEGKAHIVGLHAREAVAELVSEGGEQVVVCLLLGREAHSYSEQRVHLLILLQDLLVLRSTTRKEG